LLATVPTDEKLVPLKNWSLRAGRTRHGPPYRSLVSRPRSAAALVAGVFLAVVAVVLAATMATGRGHPGEAPAASADVRIAPAADPAADSQNPDYQNPADQAPEQSVSQVPDTSLAAGNTALYTRAGTLVAQGDALRIERVALDSPATVDVRGASVTVDSVFRITISAGPYEMRDMPAIVSINDRALSVGVESTDLADLVAFTFDSSVVSAGATLAVSYGLPGSVPSVWSTTVEVVQ
jgi:hypothetical protein